MLDMLFGNVVSNAGTDIREGAESVTGAVRSGVQNAENVVENAGNSVTSGVKNTGNAIESATTGNDGYTATRTATTNNMGGINSTMWIWVTMAVAAIAIIALVWYYGMQNNVSKNSHED